MKAILLCAGRGTRLDPLTRERPKCLVSVGGRAILDHQIGALHANGVHDVIVVAGYARHAIHDHVETLPASRRPTIVHNPAWSTASSISSVWAARSFLGGPFCVMNGDTIFEPKLLGDVLSRADRGVNLAVEPALAEPDDMRVTIGPRGIEAVGKNLKWSQANMRSLGVIISPDGANSSYRDMLDQVMASPDGYLQYHHHIVDRLARSGTVNPIVVREGRWQEIDTPEDILRWESRLAAAA